MTEKIFASILFYLLIVPCFVADGQQQLKMPTIGWLGATSAQDGDRELFRRELGKLGYFEGKNLAFESRYADTKLERLPALAEELVRLRVDVLITSGTREALALKNATKTIPIIFFAVTDPVAAGLVESLARPGGNITGFTTLGTVLAGKRLELLKETVSNLSRVAVVWEPQVQGSAQEWQESQLPARELGLQLHSMEVSSADKYEIAFQEAIKARSGALAVIASPLAVGNQKRIVELATKNRLPAIYHRGNWLAHRGLMSYGTDSDERRRRGAIFVDKILKGTKPADIPVEQPKKFEFIVNLKAAKQINLSIPPQVLARADKVIR